MGSSIAVLIEQITGKGVQNLGGLADFIGLDKPKKKKNGTATQNKDAKKVTPRGIAKKNARSALVVGSPKGILSVEDQGATSGRGTLLGN